VKRLTEIYGIKGEGHLDDVENQLNRSRSVLGGPTTEPSVRKHQDRARRHSTSTGVAQSELDSAQSISKKEAVSAGAWDSKSTDELFDELVNLTDSLPPEMKSSVLQVIMALQKKVGDGADKTPFSPSMTASRSVGGLKLQ
jgi:hypothetical protein